MSICEKDIHNIAKLANIYIPKEKIAYMASELDSIMHWIDQLKTVDISNVVLHQNLQSMPERKDIVTESNCRSEILANAPDAIDQWFSVPKIIKQ